MPDVVDSSPTSSDSDDDDAGVHTGPSFQALALYQAIHPVAFDRALQPTGPAPTASSMSPANAVNSTFDIDINYSGDPAYADTFRLAAEIWSTIITADLPDVQSATYGFIDDLAIDVDVAAIDGAGATQAQAGWDELRNGSNLPDHGTMTVDSADVGTLAASGQLFDTVLHEMGHVLGIGTLWDTFGLRSGHTYTGTGGLAEYRVLTGNSGETSVPLETGGGPGTADSHWSDAVFAKELMTGYADTGINPLSRMTIASLRDLGYIVDVGAGDPYALSGHTVTDDYAGTQRTAGVLSAGGTLTGKIEVVDDHDWFKVQLSAGSTYSFAAQGASTGQGTLSDPVVGLYNSSGRVVAFNDDDGSTQNARVFYTPSTSGTYYVGVASYGGASSGTYTLSDTTGTAGQFTPDGSWTTASRGIEPWYVGDFTGDGKDDIFRYAPSISGAQVFASDGTQFVNAGNWTPAGHGPDRWSVGDFDGDGKDDIMRYAPAARSGAQVLLSDGNSFDFAGSWTGASHGAEPWYVGDFNGDGKDDIMRYAPAARSGAQVLLSNGNSFDFAGSWTGASHGREPWYVGDFNGDGKDDIMRSLVAGNNQVFLSTGTGFESAGTWTTADHGPQRWYVGDFNADGKDDIFRYSPGSSGADMFLSNGASFTAAGSWTSAGPGPSRWSVGDFTGNGSDDIFRYLPGRSGADMFLSP